MRVTKAKKRENAPSPVNFRSHPRTNKIFEKTVRKLPNNGSVSWLSLLAETKKKKNNKNNKKNINKNIKTLQIKSYLFLLIINF